MQQRLEPRDEQNLGDPVVIPRLGQIDLGARARRPPIDPRARAPAFVRAHEEPDRAARRRSANHGREPRKRSDASSAFFRKGPFRLGYDRKSAAHRDPPSKAKDVRDRHEYYGADIKLSYKLRMEIWGYRARDCKDGTLAIMPQSDPLSSLTVSISILVVTIKRDIYNRHGEGGQRSLFCK
jgi:hypothetical protein